MGGVSRFSPMESDHLNISFIRADVELAHYLLTPERMAPAFKRSITFVLPSRAASRPKAVSFACQRLDAIGAAIPTHMKAVRLAYCADRQD